MLSIERDARATLFRLGPVLVLSAGAAMMLACGSGNSASNTAPAFSPSPTATLAVAATRPAYAGVDGNWQGGDQYLICVEDRSGIVGDAELKSATEATLINLASAASPGLPVRVEAGCPYDYPDGIVITRDAPGKYTLQIYVYPSSDAPSIGILEHWFRGNSDGATPITHEMRLPLSLIGDNAALEAALARLVPPDFTRPRVVTPSPAPTRRAPISTERCPAAPHSEAVSGAGLGDASKNFCILWADTYADETGFRITLTYHEGGERFVHAVGPNQQDFVFPPDERPILDAVPECTKRRSYTIEVWVIRPRGEEPVGASSVTAECGGR